MDTVWHVRQCEGITCTLMYIDWWPDDRRAGSMRERMFKIIYNWPYASHATATSSHIVKYWYRITWYESIMSILMYIYIDETSRDVRINSVPVWRCFGCSVYCPHIRHAVLSINHTYSMLTYKLSLATHAHAQSIANWGWFFKAFRKTCKQIHVSR